MMIMDKEEPIVNNKRSKKNHKVKKTKKVKNNTLFYKLLSFFMVILSCIMIGNIMFNGFFPISLTIIIVLILGVCIFFITYFLNKEHLRNWVKNIMSILAIFILIIDIIFLIFGPSTIKLISNFTDTGYRLETYGIYTLASSNIKNLKELDNKNVAYLEHINDEQIEVALKKLKKKQKLYISYEDDVEKLIKSLNEDNDAIIMETSYENIIKDEFPNLYEKIKRIDSIDVVSKISVLKSNINVTKEPFIMYVSGVDTVGNVQSKARSDVNLLLVVNPKTKQVLLINTPRDYYVTLNSKGKKDKLTHAGMFGIEESVHTLEDLYDIKIDYYTRVNFTSFMKMVNALDGVTVDVPISFCEQNSDRSFSKKDLICLKKGVQTLNGEEALAFARHRKSYALGDVKRGENQMILIEAIINKALSPKIITKYSSVINALKDQVSTNMTVNEMFLLARNEKNNKGKWSIVKLNASGNMENKACYSTGSAKLAVITPSESSIKEIKENIENIMSTKNS